MACASAAIRKIRRKLLQADRRLRRIRLSREPRRELRASRLRFGLDQMPLSRCVSDGPAQQPADGFLCDRRSSCATRRSMAWRCGPSMSTAPNWDCTLENSPAPQGDLHPRHASMRGDILTTHAVRLGFRQIDGFSEDWGKKIESVRGRGFELRPRSLAAHRPAAQGAEEARPCRCVQFARAQPPRCAMGREGAADAPATRTICRCSRGPRCRSSSPTRICRRCRRASR